MNRFQTDPPMICLLCLWLCIGDTWIPNGTVDLLSQKDKLKALVYDILPPTTAMVDYAIGPEKLSANEQFFDDAQTAVSL